MQQPQVPMMQPLPTPPTPRSENAALHYGLIFGGIISLIDVIYSYLADNGTIAWFSGLVESLYQRLPLILANIVVSIVAGSPIFVLLLVSCMLAGLFAALKSRRASSGALAALLVGGVFLVVDVLIAGVLLTVLVIFPQVTQQPELRGSILRDIVVYELGIDLVLLGFGVLLGWLGGVMGGGKGTPAQPYMFVPLSSYPPQGFAPASMYPIYGQPMQPGQPDQPMQPGQPG